MNNKIEEIYIIDALRTPIGKLNGMLSHLRPDDLAAFVVREIITKNNIDPDWVDGIILGCANQAGEDNRNVARMAGMLSGLSYTATATTINSLCSSGIDSVIMAIRCLALGEGEMYLAGGVESMSRSPLITSKTDGSIEDSLIGWRFVNSEIHHHFPPLSMPQTAELLAEKYNISRQEQDKYAFNSRLKYENALNKGKWEKEIAIIKDKRGLMKSTDEQHRILTLQLLSKLPHLLKKGKSITSGNAARIGDGAALIALASGKFIRKNKIKPIARVKAWSSAACHPNNMSLSAVYAAQKAMNKTGISIEEIDWLELSEAFAVQAIACTRELGANPQKVNPNGGALTIGNPISVSSARLLVSLSKEMGRNSLIKTGMASSCAGLGTGSAIILEAVTKNI